MMFVHVLGVCEGVRRASFVCFVHSFLPKGHFVFAVLMLLMCKHAYTIAPNTTPTPFSDANDVCVCTRSV
jgi:hypothetical protein